MEWVLIGVIALIVMLAIGFPIFVAIGLSSVIMLQSGIVSPELFSESLFTGLDSFPFIAIPLFILTGSAIVATGLSDRLLDLSLALFGSFKTGVGTSVNFGSGIFATISGSNAADAAAIGRISLGPLQDVGYPRKYAAAMIASGSSTGILIPPSISYIIAGIALGVSVAQLFIAAFLPGLILLMGVAVMNIIINRRSGYEAEHESEYNVFNARRAVKSTWKAKYALLAPVIILGGIYSGIFTATEAAIVAVTVIFAIGLGTGTLLLKDYGALLEESALINAMIGPIIATALIFGELLTLNRIPQLVADQVGAITGGYATMIVALFIIFFVAGATMELGPNILILGPLFYPLATGFGMDPIHYTIFMMSSFAIGFVTPPIGINLYVLAGVSEEPVLGIAKEAIPFVIIMSILTLLIGFIPVLSLIFV